MRACRAGLVGGLVISCAVVVPAPAGAHSLAPKGRIIFTSNRGGNDDVYVMNADGTNQVRLTTAPGSDWSGAWSPDYRWIAFYSDRDGNRQIYLMRQDGSGQRRVTSTSTCDWYPDWTPDGQQVVFQRAPASDCIADSDIVLRDLRSGAETTFEPDNGFSDDTPMVSPDGSKIAFASDRSGTFDIWVMNIDGSGLTRLTSDPLVDWGPKWSTDGSQILFTRFDVSPGCCHGDIYVMNSDGSGVTLLNGGDGPWQHPTWSPNGKMIALTLCCDWSYDIGIMSLDGTKTRYVSQNSAVDHSPDWGK